MIRAEKLIGKDRREWIKVQFKYHEDIVRAIGSVSGAQYSKQLKMWAVPYRYKEEFEEKCGDFLIQWLNDEDRDKSNGGISEDLIPSEPIVPGYSVTYDEDRNIVGWEGFKNKPWGEFQVKGFNALVSKDFLILADDAGLGKTYQVGCAIEAKKKLGHLNRGIILAKASLLYNWRDEIHMHTHEKAHVVAGTIKQRCKVYNELEHSDDWTFLIMSYETFRGDVKNLQLLDNYKPLDFCVMDEAHKIKNPQSKIGSLIHNIPFKYRVIMTATPLPNSPLEAYNYLAFGKRIDMNWWQFQNTYAIMGGFGGKEVVGYKNIRELKNVIQTNMLRRRKQDKLKELPDVTFKTVNVEMTKEQRKTYLAIKDEILEDLKDTSLDKVPSALAKLLRLQQVTDSIELIGSSPGKNTSSKLLAIDDMLEEIIEQNGEKVIIFSRFREMVELIRKRYSSKYNPAIIHGDIDANGRSRTSAERALKKRFGESWWSKTIEERNKLIEDEMTSERQNEVYKFQNDDSCKLFIGSAPACREGLTLTKATHVIFVDCEWSPAYVEQAYSRAHRIGQKNAVTVYYMVCEGTIDEHVQETLKRKETMAQFMIDEGIESVGQTRAKELIASMIGEEMSYS